MRLNVYEEELTDEIVLISTEAKGHKKPFFGCRIFLKSPDELSNTAADDDRSAITFFFSNPENATILRDAIKRSMVPYVSKRDRL